MSSKKKGRKKGDRAGRSAAAGQAPQVPVLRAPQATLASELAKLGSNLDALRKGDGQAEAPLLEALRGPLGLQLVLEEKLAGNKLLGIAIAHDKHELRLLPAVTQRLKLGGDIAERVTTIVEGGQPAHVAVLFRAPACLDVALAMGAPVDTAVPPTGLTLLHILHNALGAESLLSMASVHMRMPSREEQLRAVRRMAASLKRAGADVAAADGEGKCPVVSALEALQMETAAIIIETFATGPDSQHERMRFAAYCERLIAAEAEGKLAVCSSREVEALLKALHCAWQPGGYAGGQLLPVHRPPAGAHEPGEVAALIEAAMQRNAQEMARFLLLAANADAVRLRVPGGGLPWVHLALRAQAAGTLPMLRECGVDLAASWQGETALSSALQMRCTHFAAALLALASEPQLERLLRQADRDGLTALGYCVSHDCPEELPLMLQACKRAGLGVSGLLERHEAFTSHHWPVFAAVLQGRTGALEQLLAAGLDLGSRACSEHVERATEADGLGAAILREPRERTETVTLLMCAVSTGNLPAVRLLLAAGVDARHCPAGNSRFTDAVTVVLRGLTLGTLMGRPRPEADIAALTQPFQHALEGRCVELSTKPPNVPAAISEWLREWAGVAGAGARFECLLLLLWHGAALAKRQLSELLVLRVVCSTLGWESAATAALRTFLWKRLKSCSGCGLLGRWRRCACKQEWYCGRACQKRHWKAEHERECPLAQ